MSLEWTGTGTTVNAKMVDDEMYIKLDDLLHYLKTQQDLLNDKSEKEIFHQLQKAFIRMKHRYKK